MGLETFCGHMKNFESYTFSILQTNFIFIRNSKSLAIFTAYFLCPNTNPQPHTYNFKVYTQLKKNNDLKSPYSLQKKCWKDFNDYISELIHTSNEIIIGMDEN